MCYLVQRSNQNFLEAKTISFLHAENCRFLFSFSVCAARSSYKHVVASFSHASGERHVVSLFYQAEFRTLSPNETPSRLLWWEDGDFSGFFLAAGAMMPFSEFWKSKLKFFCLIPISEPDLFRRLVTPHCRWDDPVFHVFTQLLPSLFFAHWFSVWSWHSSNKGRPPLLCLADECITLTEKLQGAPLIIIFSAWRHSGDELVRRRGAPQADMRGRGGHEKL